MLFSNRCYSQIWYCLLKAIILGTSSNRKAAKSQKTLGDSSGCMQNPTQWTVRIIRCLCSLIQSRLGSYVRYKVLGMRDPHERKSSPAMFEIPTESYRADPITYHSQNFASNRLRLHLKECIYRSVNVEKYSFLQCIRSQVVVCIPI